MLYLFGFFYGGPDTVLPMASALAAIGGLLLMLWKQVTMFLTRFFRLFRKRSSNSASDHSTN